MSLALPGVPADRATRWAPHLEEAMRVAALTTPHQRAAFLAQVLHESGMLRYVREIWSPAQVSAQARYEDGFLSVLLPKIPEPKTVHITLTLPTHE